MVGQKGTWSQITQVKKGPGPFLPKGGKND